MWACLLCLCVTESFLEMQRRLMWVSTNFCWLAGWPWCVCVCVCVWERERERERGLSLELTYLKPELLPCPLTVLSKCRGSVCTGCLSRYTSVSSPIPFHNPHLSMKEGRKEGCLFCFSLLILLESSQWMNEWMNSGCTELVSWCFDLE